jgi:hypothetical protein
VHFSDKVVSDCTFQFGLAILVTSLSTRGTENQRRPPPWSRHGFYNGPVPGNSATSQQSELEALGTAAKGLSKSVDVSWARP